ncbi:hypothetical protein Dda_7086 [Drechslerella dactyloides]|uniref:Uncharacterized protein n=1 Tax=Drechslerella dactyloides TaxID=74499 RepID=A0AAD6IUB1_DREDA|nr:hypothetical protein Dda_7086 [Drechslerella dactyloides]
MSIEATSAPTNPKNDSPPKRRAPDSEDLQQDESASEQEESSLQQDESSLHNESPPKRLKMSGAAIGETSASGGTNTNTTGGTNTTSTNSGTTSDIPDWFATYVKMRAEANEHARRTLEELIKHHKAFNDREGGHKGFEA